jgi:hypothetical protein
MAVTWGGCVEEREAREKHTQRDSGRSEEREREREERDKERGREKRQKIWGACPPCCVFCICKRRARGMCRKEKRLSTRKSDY